MPMKRNWADRKGQKVFLDSLLNQFNIAPAKLTYTMIRENGGRPIFKFYDNMRELLKSHYGPISLLDMPRVPPGTWAVKANRIEAVREAVNRLQKMPEDIMLEDFYRVGLKGLVNSSGKTHIPLLQEAGFNVPDPVSWESLAKRSKVIRDLVKTAGGIERLTFRKMVKAAPGLAEYYKNKYAGRKRKKPIPLLYWILKDAGFKVTPEQCRRGLGTNSLTVSRHGHINHSIAEADIDDWIYDLVGNNHLHDIMYPGQGSTPKRHSLNCDFVIIRDGQEIQDGIWIEYAGLAGENRNTAFHKRYKEKLEKKKALAQKADIVLYIIREPDEKLGTLLKGD